MAYFIHLYLVICETVHMNIGTCVKKSQRMEATSCLARQFFLMNMYAYKI